MPGDERQIGFLISDVARLMRTVFDRRVRRLGLTRAQWLVLTRLQRRPGVSQSELAEMLEVEKPAAGRMVDRLEKKGWVERRADAGDRRVKRLYLTAAADRIAPGMRALAEQTVEDALAPLSAPETAQLSRSLERVKRRLQGIVLERDAAERQPGIGESGEDDPAEPEATPILPVAEVAG